MTPPPGKKGLPRTLEGRVAGLQEALQRDGIGTSVVSRYRRLVRDVYGRCGRMFPWRETADPYAILISEFMLQQTPVERVEGKYPTFLSAFPDFDALAEASLSEVLALWQGLGYNRRVRALQCTAREVRGRYGGSLPADREKLLRLPGVGPSTAGAVRAFAYGLPAAFIETNIRRVFIHVFFQGRDDVRDGEILPLVERTLDRRDPRNWYYALMDFGAVLPGGGKNPNRRSAHYARQSPFEGSDRQIRGAVLGALLRRGPLEEDDLCRQVSVEPARGRGIIGALQREGLVRERNGKYMIA